jgi:ABC-2 type transport system permease protein
MLAIYKRLWQVNWAEQWQYRANLVMYLFFWLVSPIVYLAVWTTIANTQGSVNGMSAQNFVSYYMILLVVNITTSDITVYLLANRIMDGTLSNMLILPIHPVLTHVLMNNLAFKVLQLIALAPIWAVLYLLYQPVLTLSPINLLLAIPALLMGFLIMFFFGAIITSVAFWTTRIWALWDFFNALFGLLGGQFVPLALLPPTLQTIAHLLPFQLSLYFPIELILGKLTPEQIALNLGLQAIWCLLTYGLFRLIWRAGIRNYSAVGA